MKQLLETIKKDYPKVWEEFSKWFIDSDLIHIDFYTTYYEDIPESAGYDHLELFFDDNETIIETRCCYIKNTTKYKYIIKFNFEPDGDHYFCDISHKFCETRTEATKQAILKASEILEQRLREK